MIGGIVSVAAAPLKAVRVLHRELESSFRLMPIRRFNAFGVQAPDRSITNAPSCGDIRCANFKPCRLG